MNFKFDEDEQKVLDIIHEFGVNEVAPWQQRLTNRNVSQKKTGKD